MRLTVQRQWSNDATAGTAAAIAVDNVQTWVTYTPVLASGSVIDSMQSIQNMELYTNNIFVNPEIHDIYIQRIGFTLIRVHRYQQFKEDASTKNELLSQMKWPLENLMVGLRPSQNISAANPNQYRDWHRLTLLTDQQLDAQSAAQGDVMTDDAIAFNAASAAHKRFSSVVAKESVVFSNVQETIQTIQLQVHGINIYQTTKAAFFRDYLTYVFGGANLNTPDDQGALFINFCLYPGTYNPSGHLNVSRAREFYLEYVSNYVTPASPADLLILAIAIKVGR